MINTVKFGTIYSKCCYISRWWLTVSTLQVTEHDCLKQYWTTQVCKQSGWRHSQKTEPQCDTKGRQPTATRNEKSMLLREQNLAVDEILKWGRSKAFVWNKRVSLQTTYTWELIRKSCYCADICLPPKTPNVSYDSWRCCFPLPYMLTVCDYLQQLQRLCLLSRLSTNTSCYFKTIHPHRAMSITCKFGDLDPTQLSEYFLSFVVVSLMMSIYISRNMQLTLYDKLLCSD